MVFNDKNPRARLDRQQQPSESQARLDVPAMRLRSVCSRVGAAVLIVSVCIMAAGVAPPDGRQSAEVQKIDAKALATLVQSFHKVKEQKHPWGWIRWLMDSKLDPKTKMTFGIVQIDAGQRNPLHIHSNCEEILYVLSGSCEHVIGEQSVMLKRGDVIRIPAGVPHKARTFDKEPLTAVIVYSSGDRQFTVVEEGNP